MPPIGASRDLRSLVQQHIDKNKVMIFSKSYCPYCNKVSDSRHFLGCCSLHQRLTIYLFVKCIFWHSPGLGTICTISLAVMDLAISYLYCLATLSIRWRPAITRGCHSQGAAIVRVTVRIRTPYSYRLPIESPLEERGGRSVGGRWWYEWLAPPHFLIGC